jgi:hypothetical protein
MNTLLCAGAMTKGVRSEIGFRINALLLDAGGSHADPVVPILLALVVLTLAAVLGGRIMTLMKQPAVLGELLVGLVIGNRERYVKCRC